MKFKIYRDCDARLRLRKIVIELRDADGELLDRTRMFAGPGLKRRIKMRCKRMVRRAGLMLSGIR